MTGLSVQATYIGGPTALLEIAGVRFLTDPTFDPAGTDYETPVYTLRKTIGPAISAQALGAVDAVLLSHDHHFDNLDRTGRNVATRAARVLTPPAGAQRLGGSAIGLAPWQTIEVVGRNGHRVSVTGTPARHGPAEGDRGPVVGFLLTDGDGPRKPDTPAVYVSGDTVWYKGVEEVARRADVRVAFLFLGAARVREVGPAHLTMTGGEGVLAAHAMPHAEIVPLHFEGWQHFSEGRSEIEQTFAAVHLDGRLRWLAPGQPTVLAGV